MDAADTQPERACRICAKRFEASSPNGALRLECRARPPAQDVAQYARFPVVQPDFYCFSDFLVDGAVTAEALRTSSVHIEISAAPAASVEPGADGAHAVREYPHLTDAQIQALDRVPDDGVSRPGGSPKRARRAPAAEAAEPVAEPAEPPATDVADDSAAAPQSLF